MARRGQAFDRRETGSKRMAGTKTRVFGENILTRPESAAYIPNLLLSTLRPRSRRARAAPGTLLS